MHLVSTYSSCSNCTSASLVPSQCQRVDTTRRPDRCVPPDVSVHQIWVSDVYQRGAHCPPVSSRVGLGSAWQWPNGCSYAGQRLVAPPGLLMHKPMLRSTLWHGLPVAPPTACRGHINTCISASAPTCNATHPFKPSAPSQFKHTACHFLPSTPHFSTPPQGGAS
jgi:hypothetical protein